MCLCTYKACPFFYGLPLGVSPFKRRWIFGVFLGYKVVFNTTYGRFFIGGSNEVNSNFVIIVTRIDPATMCVAKTNAVISRELPPKQIIQLIFFLR